MKKNERESNRTKASKSEQQKEIKERNQCTASQFFRLVKVMGPCMEKALHFLICSQILNEIGGQEGG